MKKVRRILGLESQPSPTCGQRRRVLAGLAAGMVCLSLPELAEAATRKDARTLAFTQLHTGESLSLVYRVGHAYIPRAFDRLRHLLRDFRTEQTHSMDPELYDLLWHLHREVDSNEPFEIISAYRSPQTNRMLRARSAHSGVAKHSLHMYGRAIDIRLADVHLAHLHHAAVSLKRGGVGYYPRSNFIHVDTGRVRYWGS